MNLTEEKLLFDDIVIDENQNELNYVEVNLFDLENKVNTLNNLEIIEPLLFNEPEKQLTNSTVKETPSIEIQEEPLFRVVIPKRRTWFYNVQCFFKGMSFIKRWFGTEIKALPAPSEYKFK